VRALTAWRDRKDVPAAQRQELDRTAAEIHGANGIPVRWQVRTSVPAIPERFAALGPEGDPAAWSTRFATGTEARVAPPDLPKNAVWFATTEVAVPEATAIEFLASSGGSLQVWLNGEALHRRDQPRKYQIDSDRFAGTLVKGGNRLLVRVGPAASAEFHLRFRRKSTRADHERLTQAALTRAGNPERGRQVFLDVEKSQCLKCHRLGDQGERIGPELTGVGSRFGRIYLVESILEPSRTIAPSFETLAVSLRSGVVLTGVKVGETATALTLADNQGRTHVLPRAAIEAQQPSPVSTMPEGLEQRLREDEFVDLIAFLASQKAARR
jgi:putative heme-binding domain-containing protein